MTLLEWIIFLKWPAPELATSRKLKRGDSETREPNRTFPVFEGEFGKKRECGEPKILAT